MKHKLIMVFCLLLSTSLFGENNISLSVRINESTVNFILGRVNFPLSFALIPAYNQPRGIETTPQDLKKAQTVATAVYGQTLNASLSGNSSDLARVMQEFRIGKEDEAEIVSSIQQSFSEAFLSAIYNLLNGTAGEEDAPFRRLLNELQEVNPSRQIFRDKKSFLEAFGLSADDFESSTAIAPAATMILAVYNPAGSRTFKAYPVRFRLKNIIKSAWNGVRNAVSGILHRAKDFLSELVQAVLEIRGFTVENCTITVPLPPGITIANPLVINGLTVNVYIKVALAYRFAGSNGKLTASTNNISITVDSRFPLALAGNEVITYIKFNKFDFNYLKFFGIGNAQLGLSDLINILLSGTEIKLFTLPLVPLTNTYLARELFLIPASITPNVPYLEINYTIR